MPLPHSLLMVMPLMFTEPMKYVAELRGAFPQEYLHSPAWIREAMFRAWREFVHKPEVSEYSESFASSTAWSIESATVIERTEENGER